MDKKIVAKPTIKLIPISKNKAIDSVCKTFQDYYRHGIIENKERNLAITTEVKRQRKKGITTLILIKEIQHGIELLTLLKKRKVNATFVAGSFGKKINTEITSLKKKKTMAKKKNKRSPKKSLKNTIDKLSFKIKTIEENTLITTDKKERMIIKKMLDKKQLDVVIASVIWKEGVNIKTLGQVINAFGGKSDISTEQVVGRGLRGLFVIVVDFLDPYKYLAEHAIKRINLYKRRGWKIK